MKYLPRTRLGTFSSVVWLRRRHSSVFAADAVNANLLRVQS